MFPFGSMPSGWFQIGWSGDFHVGEARALRFFGVDLVGYRGESGVLHVLDAHCPHLGAHLGVGGSVVGDDIVCPFHAWRFDGNGRNVDIPYSTRVRDECVGVWTLEERAPLVWMWHDQTRGAPTWDVPRIAETEDPAYYGWYFEEPLELRMRPQYLTENSADVQHFVSVHGWLEAEEETFDVTGARYHNVIRGKVPTPKGLTDVRLENEVFGVGITISRLSGMIGDRDFTVLAACTPIDGEMTRIHVSSSVRKPAGDVGDEPDSVARAVARAQAQEVAIKDAPIWANLDYVTRPPFAPEEAKTYGAMRRWVKQFYPHEPVQ